MYVVFAENMTQGPRYTVWKPLLPIQCKAGMLVFCAWLTQVAGVSRREFFDVTDQLREIFKWEESWQSWLESEETFVIRDLGQQHFGTFGTLAWAPMLHPSTRAGKSQNLCTG